jgi:hypothetical protein
MSKFKAILHNSTSTFSELTMLAEGQTYLSQPTATGSQQQYGFQHSAELSIPLKQNLRNLKNVLKLPKARRFATFLRPLINHKI